MYEIHTINNTKICSDSLDKLNTDSDNNKKNVFKQNNELKDGLNNVENNKSNIEIKLVDKIYHTVREYIFHLHMQVIIFNILV